MSRRLRVLAVGALTALIVSSATVTRVGGVSAAANPAPTAAAEYARQWNLRAINAESAWSAGLLGSRGVAVAVLLIVGGGVYSFGAVIYATKWPDPIPRIFGFHELFHLLVVAAAVIQFVAVSLVVM